MTSKKKEYGKYDGGYGSTGNLAVYVLLHDVLNDEQCREYRSQLEKEDKRVYNEYLEWEQIMDKYS